MMGKVTIKELPKDHPIFKAGWIISTVKNQSQKIKQYEKELLEWCEKQELNLSSANKKKLCKSDTWKKHLRLVAAAKALQNVFGDKLYVNFNDFKKEVDDEVKAQKLTISASDKKAILNAVSWYDTDAEKVIKKVEKLSGPEMEIIHFLALCMPLGNSVLTLRLLVRKYLSLPKA